MQRSFSAGFMQQPFRIVNIPPNNAAAYHAMTLSRPTVILEKPTYTSCGMKPLFAPANEGEPAAKRPKTPPPPKHPAFVSTPSPPNCNARRPGTEPSSGSSGVRYASDDFVYVAGRTFRNSSMEEGVSIVSTKDMLSMDLPDIGSNTSSQDDPQFTSSQSSIDGQITSIRVGKKFRNASKEEMVAIISLSQMSSNSASGRP
jgi:hypothetical protein